MKHERGIIIPEIKERAFPGIRKIQAYNLKSSLIKEVWEERRKRRKKGRSDRERKGRREYTLDIPWHILINVTNFKDKKELYNKCQS